jgi:hypothetical protein
LVKEMPILNQIATKVSALATKVQDKVVNSCSKRKSEREGEG